MGGQALTYRKFRNQPVTVAGRRFDSKREAGRFGELLLLEKAGEISSIECQVRYDMVVNGRKICTYVADFRYLDRDGRLVVEDVKSPASRTPAYRIKAKLMAALHGVEIKEVM